MSHLPAIARLVRAGAHWRTAAALVVSLVASLGPAAPAVRALASPQFAAPASSQEVSSPILSIYEGWLAPGWHNQSWGGTATLAAGPRYERSGGEKSLVFAPAESWGALSLTVDGGLDASRFTTLSFAARLAEQPAGEQRYGVLLFDASNRQLRELLPLTGYGRLSAEAWTVFSISLADLGANAGTIGRIAIQEASGHRVTLYVDALRLVAGASADASQPAPVPLPAAAPATAAEGRFGTLPVGASLPSGEECAARVRRSPWEPRPENQKANQTTGAMVPGPYTGANGSMVAVDGPSRAWNERYGVRVDGNFTGTTDEIIQWGACKWGLDEEIVRAMATKETWWRQGDVGDATSDAPTYGILQVRGSARAGTFPRVAASTAFSVDYSLAWRRACFDGDLTFLRDRGRPDAAGDEWGCVGMWFSGDWYDGQEDVPFSGARWYIAGVKEHVTARRWLLPGFGLSGQ